MPPTSRPKCAGIQAKPVNRGGRVSGARLQAVCPGLIAFSRGMLI